MSTTNGKTQQEMKFFVTADGRTKKEPKRIATSVGRFAFKLDKKLGVLDLPATTRRYSVKEGAKVATECMLRGRLDGHSAWYWVSFDDGHLDLRHGSQINFNFMDTAEDLVRFDLTRIHDPDPGGLWWRSERGALERAVTWIEAIRITIGVDVTPSPGWTAIDGFAHAGALAQAMPSSSELAEKARAESRAAKLARLEGQAENARAAVKRWQRSSKLAETLLAKWTMKLNKRERVLAAFKNEKKG